jgi:sugar (pentulose or hexulose) kinase
VSPFLLAIDGGSQSTKVSVLDASGQVHATAQAPLRPYTLTPDGQAVHPDDDLWDSLVAACREALATWRGSASAIVGIGLCGIRFCRVYLDAAGHLTEPVLSWMDARVSQPIDPAVLDPAVATITSAGGYLAVRLTGERRDSYASFQGMWPIDPVARDWSHDDHVLAQVGMPRSLLPDLVDPGALLGRVTRAAADATGLPVDCPVFATSNDKAVEALGCGLDDDHTLLLSLGTYICSMTIGDDPRAGDDRYWVNTAAVPGRFLYESGGIRRGMWTVSWLRDLVSAQAPPGLSAVQVQQWLNAGAAEVPPGSAGLFTVPDWLAPTHAPWRRGAIVGLVGGHGPFHLYRSILEGIVLTMHQRAGEMGEALGRSFSRLVVSGGGSRSDVMMSVVADVFGMPASRTAVPDAVAVGAAICAAVGARVHGSFEAAMAAMVRPGDTVEPDPLRQESYQVVTRQYAALPLYTDPMFQRLASLGGAVPPTDDPSPR